MKIKKYNFKKAVKIYNIGDVHRGNNSCDLGFLHKVIDKIKGEKNSYWVSTGDLLEVGTKDSVSGPYDSLTVQEELDFIVEELKPIRAKCLGLVASNHHERVKRSTGLSLDKAVCNALDIPFLGITGVIDIVVGRAAYYCVLHHGVGGGTQGNKVNRAINMAKIHAGADVYLSGHTHSYSYTPFLQKYVDKKRCIVSEMLCHSVVTGHFLNWSGSYAERMALTPAPVGCSVITLFPSKNGRNDKKKVEVQFFSK